MKISLLVNDNVIPLNDFTQRYVANILHAIVNSLGEDSKNITMRIGPEGPHIYADDKEVVIKKDFARGLIESTV